MQLIEVYKEFSFLKLEFGASNWPKGNVLKQPIDCLCAMLFPMSAEV
jgi:hypothetical protein